MEGKYRKNVQKIIKDIYLVIKKYSVVIPSADSTTGYISIEHNNQTLKININKK